ncbi:MAG: cupin domain-containing protein [Clostridiales bacterium]|jgi:quercetin dioxygenase-like cupin family protein|nr:cupin domain-containing protein [Clostridiales bacterium]MDR2752136.1 cupin domain-containing protein [Clostridiales bacterium]
MTEQLVEIGARLRTLREIMDYTPEALAQKLEMPVSDYLQHESGELDFSFSFLYNAAHILGVDVLDLMSGESPKLSRLSLVRNGQGFDITRRKAYNYKHLAYTFKDKKAEPFMVTVETSDQVPKLHSHEGQEFDYMISGSMKFYLGDYVATLNQGDSVYYDSSIPHAMKAEGGTASFLAFVMK